jgi:hypothetical protein
VGKGAEYRKDDSRVNGDDRKRRGYRLLLRMERTEESVDGLEELKGGVQDG